MVEDFEHREERYERESRRNGIIVAIILHSIIILFFVVTMAWTPPDPPPPRYGIEVNFGFESNGSGSVQNKTKPNKSESLEKAKPNPKPTEQPAPEPKPVPKPDPVQPKPTPTPQPETTESTPVTETREEAVEVVEKPTPKPNPTPTPKPKEEVKPVEKTPAETGGGSPADNDGTADEDVANNQGDNPNPDAVGDQGKQDGSLNEDALLGGGAGGGAQLSLDGWRWDQEPDVRDGSSDTGTVTIRFKIDEEGTVVSAAISSGYTVTPGVAEFYRQYVEREMTFSPKAGLGKLPKFTLGSITFIITSK